MWDFLVAQVSRVYHASVWSLAGLRATWATEMNFRQWTVANILSAALAFSLDLGGLERAVIIGFGLNILVVELLNTSVEKTIDRFSLDIHPMAKIAKDVGSAAVALSAITALIVWLLVLFG